MLMVITRHATPPYVLLMSMSPFIPAYRAPPGTMNAAGDDASGGKTECGECAENYYVSSNVCTLCPVSTTNIAGDDVSGNDTTCDSHLMFC